MTVTGKFLFVLLGASLSLALPARAMDGLSSDSASAGASLCLDSMETEPFDDDQDATPISATIDGTCLVPDQAVSI